MRQRVEQKVQVPDSSELIELSTSINCSRMPQLRVLSLAAPALVFSTSCRSKSKSRWQLEELSIRDAETFSVADLNNLLDGIDALPVNASALRFSVELPSTNPFAGTALMVESLAKRVPSAATIAVDQDAI